MPHPKPGKPPHPSTWSSRAFSRDIGAAKRAADAGPVIITDHGRPAYALLSIEAYYELGRSAPQSLFEVMECIPSFGPADFEAPRLPGTPRAIDLGEDES